MEGMYRWVSNKMVNDEIIGTDYTKEKESLLSFSWDQSKLRTN